MRVALVCGEFKPRLDGVADYTARLAGRLRGVGVEPLIVEAGIEPDAVLRGTKPDAVVRGTKPDAVRGTKPDAVLRGTKPDAVDVVHVQWAPTAYRAGPPPVPPAVPLVVTLHELEDLERGGMQLAASAAAVVCTGQDAAAVVRRKLPGTPVRVITIGPNVAVTSDGTPNRSGPLAVFFGFVHPVKGIPYLLDALLMVRVRHPDLRLAIVGGFESLALPEEEAASYRREVEEMVAARGLEGAVTITGWQPEEVVSCLLQSADLAVLPFTAGVTSKSGALLTVLAHGLPVVATRPPGGRERPGVISVPTRDAGALADAIGGLLEDPAEAARLAKEARASVRDDPWGAIASAHRDLYEAVTRIPSEA